jgi:predicted acylesterase/phospholipase RssA
MSSSASHLPDTAASTGTLGQADDVEAAAECDVIMKGGITSGVIYPLAICELATRYRLHNVGGTSAGAIAAAAAAAAERGRRRRLADPASPAGGYGRLAELPEELGKKLLLLFRPAPSTRSLFEIMVAASRAPSRPIVPGKPGKVERGKRLGPKLWPTIRAVIGQQLGWFLLGLLIPVALAVLVLWLAGPASAWVTVVVVVLAVLLGVVLGLVLVGWSLYRVLVNDVRDNSYGICTGYLDAAGREREEDLAGQPQPLTPWLTDLLDELAGNRERPLTFADLWGEQAAKDYRAAAQAEGGLSVAEQVRLRAAREINLEMMTTDLSHGRPWRLPTDERVLSFCPRELRRLFPKQVVDHMFDHSSWTRRHLEGQPDQTDVHCPTHPDERLRFLPLAPDLPIVVAARMSLSFPLLISAVRLYTIDYDLTDRPVVACWFSDGGITSNFPIHFFDGLLPRRPTFGLNLRTYPPDHPDEDVYLPEPIGRVGRSDWRPITNVFAFGSTLLDTLQNWADRGQMTVPGFRDRIVHVSHRPDEGGMNLAMPRDRILALAARGQRAAQLLAGTAPAGQRCFDWQQHRWTRYRTAMSKLEQGLDQMGEANADPNGYRQFLATYQPEHYRGRAGHEQQWQAFARNGLVALLKLAVGWQQGADHYVDGTPKPNPELRLTNRF